MKNFIAVLVAIAIMWALGTMCVYALTEGYQPTDEPIESNHAYDGEHVEFVPIVKTESNTVFVETARGNIYAFYGQGFEQAQECWIKIDHNTIVDAWLD